MISKELWFQNGEKKVFGLLCQPEGVEGPQPMIAYSHGFGGSHMDNVNCAERFVKAGYSVCLIDFCGGGNKSRSDGSTEEMSVLTEVGDLLAVVDGLLSQGLAKKDELYLLGESQGGFVTGLTAEKLQDKVKGIILIYPALVIPTDAKKRFPSKEDITNSTLWDMKLGAKYYQDIWDLDPYKELGSYKGPVLLFHGTADDIVPISYSERLSKQYKNLEYFEVEDAGHGFFDAVGEAVDAQIIEVLNRWSVNDLQMRDGGRICVKAEK